MDVICVVLNCPDMYERSAKILDSCFSNYRLVKIDENAIFMSDKVLCKIANSVNFLVKSTEKINFDIKPLGELKKVKRGDNVAKLEIFGQNGLILSENLYSIIDR